MAVIGDLFVNVRARTAALTKGLGRARRQLGKFARSGTGMIAGLAAGFGLFKVGQAALGAMVYHSDEFRAAFANARNTINLLLAEMATKLGPVLAEGINGFNEWMASSDYVHDVMSGLVVVIRKIGQALRGIAGFMDKTSTKIADVISRFTGVSQTQRDLERGLQADGRTTAQAIADEAERVGRRGALMAQARMAFAAGDQTTGEALLRQIRDRIEVPR